MEKPVGLGNVISNYLYQGNDNVLHCYTDHGLLQ